MKKKILFSLFVIIALFTITGCGNEGSNNKDNKPKTEVKDIQFTELITKDDIKIQYKLPKGYESNNMYLDNGVRVMFYAENYSNAVARMKEYDKLAGKIEKVTINGYEYEHYKAKYMKNYLVYI